MPGLRGWKRQKHRVLALWFLLIGLSTYTGLFNQAQAFQLGFAPVNGQLTSLFGWRVDPITGSQRFHGGVDIAAPSGVPVYALQPGYVMFSGPHGGYGNVVVLNHGNHLYTLYGHNSRLLVRAGQMVAQGQALSLVGSTGRSTGPHLHFEVHYNGQYINPLTYLSYFYPTAERQALLAHAQPHTSPASLAVAPKRSPASITVQHSRKSKSRHHGPVVELLSGMNSEFIEF